MHINFIKPYLEAKDLEFVLSLDKRLRKVETVQFNKKNSPWAKNSDKINLYKYTDSSMTREEVEKLLYIIQKRDYLFYSLNTQNLTFEVKDSKIGQTLLMFKYEQIPKSYNFDKLSKYFNRPKNPDRNTLNIEY